MTILANNRSTKQWVEHESTNMGNEGIAWTMIVTDGWRELGFERVAALSWASIGAQSGTMQLPLCVESRELLSIFASMEAVGLASDVVVTVVVTDLPLAAQEPDFGHFLTL